MNFIFVSPNYPIRYFKWVEALRDHGVTVLGIGDTPWADIPQRLKNSLNEYYYLPDLSREEDMLKACRYFESKYGKIDFIESNNEWWLEQDARLRKALNVTSGFFPEQMEKIKAKSAMKACFEAAGVKTMRYLLVNGPEDIDRVLDFAKQVGWPLFAKPNVGVGAHDSWPIPNEAALRERLAKPLPETYIVEEFIDGEIVSYDGICDSRSNVVFETTDHFPTPVADIVNESKDEYYYNNPFALPFFDVDPIAFEAAGRRVVKAFGIQKRFFHIEFFVLRSDKPGFAKKGEFVALECNMRPAGGYTPDLIDFANSVSCYEIYADVITKDRNDQDMSKEKYYAFAVSRRDELSYAHTQEEIFNQWGAYLCAHGVYPKHMADAMGDDYFYAKFKDFSMGLAFDRFVREKKLPH
jgi:hypothetical protein